MNGKFEIIKSISIGTIVEMATLLIAGITFMIMLNNKIDMLYQKIDDHIKLPNGSKISATQHLTEDQKLVLRNLSTYGFTFSQAEKADVMARLKMVEQEIAAAKLNGKMQTPAEKRELILQVLREYEQQRKGVK